MWQLRRERPELLGALESKEKPREVASDAVIQACLGRAEEAGKFREALEGRVSPREEPEPRVTEASARRDERPGSR